MAGKEKSKEEKAKKAKGKNSPDVLCRDYFGKKEIFGALLNGLLYNGFPYVNPKYLYKINPETLVRTTHCTWKNYCDVPMVYMPPLSVHIQTLNLLAEKCGVPVASSDEVDDFAAVASKRHYRIESLEQLSEEGQDEQRIVVAAYLSEFQTKVFYREPQKLLLDASLFQLEQVKSFEAYYQDLMKKGQEEIDEQKTAAMKEGTLAAVTARDGAVIASIYDNYKVSMEDLLSSETDPEGAEKQKQEIREQALKTLSAISLAYRNTSSPGAMSREAAKACLPEVPEQEDDGADIDTQNLSDFEILMRFGPDCLVAKWQDELSTASARQENETNGDNTSREEDAVDAPGREDASGGEEGGSGRTGKIQRKDTATRRVELAAGVDDDADTTSSERKAMYMSHFYRYDGLAPTVPFTFYLGNDPWRAPRCVFEMSHPAFSNFEERLRDTLTKQMGNKHGAYGVAGILGGPDAELDYQPLIFCLQDYDWVDFDRFNGSELKYTLMILWAFRRGDAAFRDILDKITAMNELDEVSEAGCAFVNAYTGLKLESGKQGEGNGVRMQLCSVLERASEAERRADAEKNRADAEKNRADAEKKRADAVERSREDLVHSLTKAVYQFVKLGEKLDDAMKAFSVPEEQWKAVKDGVTNMLVGTPA